MGWDSRAGTALGQNNGSPGGRNYFPLSWAQPRSAPTQGWATRAGISRASKGLMAAGGKLPLWVSERPVLFSKTFSSLSLGTWGVPCLASPHSHPLPPGRQSPECPNPRCGFAVTPKGKGAPQKSLGFLQRFSPEGLEVVVAWSIIPAGSAPGSLPGTRGCLTMETGHVSWDGSLLPASCLTSSGSLSPAHVPAEPCMAPAGRAFPLRHHHRPPPGLIRQQRSEERL